MAFRESTIHLTGQQWLLINAHHEEIPFVLPSFRARARWQIALDTSQPAGFVNRCRRLARGDMFPLQGRSLALLQQPGQSAKPAD